MFPWNRIRPWVRAEIFYYAFISIAGLIFFFVQLTTWALPQLTLLQEFVPAQGLVIQTRILEEIRDEEKVGHPEVLLEYKVRDQVHRIWTFDYRTLYSKQGSLFREEKVKEVLAPFEVGATVPCWYRYDEPSEVIVHWDTSLWGWFFLLFFFALAAIGLIGLVQTFLIKSISQERGLATESRSAIQTSLKSLLGTPAQFTWPCVPDIRIINESPGTQLSFRLPLGNQPLFPLVGLTLFCLAWNIVAWGVMFYSFLHSGKHFWTEQIIGIILLGTFCSFGVVLLVWVIRQILQAFGTGLTLLEISDHPIYPGRRYRVLLHQSGTLRFREFSVDIICEEIARFRQGTDTTTNRKDVFRQNLCVHRDFETTPDAPLLQEFFVQLPLVAMHSFRMENNEIAWKFEIVAQIAGWPELRRECPIVVRPTTWTDSIQEGVGL